MGKGCEDCNLQGVQARRHKRGPERLERIAAFSALRCRKNQEEKILRGM